MNMSKLLATTALGLSLGIGAAVAAPITGSVAVNTSLVVNSAHPLTAGDQITLSGATFGVGTPMLDGLFGVPLTPSVLTLTTGSTFSFTSAVGNFIGTNNVTVLSLANNIGAIIVATGVFTPLGALAGAGEANDFEMSITINQSGPSYSGTFTLSSLEGGRTDIPEPMSLALFGLGLAGLGVAMRRRA
jgi:hypothetical protein